MTATNKWLSDEARWQAIVARDKAADGHFVYGVRTSRIYCHPSAAGRLPKRDNIEFFDNEQQAIDKGYHAGKRSRKEAAQLEQFYQEKIAQACRYIEQSHTTVKLDELAAVVGISRYHFHRLFKAQTGLTPKAYADAHRHGKLQQQLQQQPRITDAIYDAGFSSNSRFYETATERLGMTPKAWKAGGDGSIIYFALAMCSLGHVLVAQSTVGVCAILLGDDPEKLLQDLEDKFPQAELIGGDSQFEQLVAKVIGFIEAPELGLNLPLDIRGTAFQQRVWQALRTIPVGSTVSYSDIAKQIGHPKAIRAVAGACAANMLAVAIPCHRVVRTDGSLSGYRWGIERKRSLLNKEAIKK
ncbi:bifunctional DNA-binding transcriptional regulator/O6-methylguanine-DNA methyltransferase Ada [Providencia vermicola]|uniref:Bifunctional DNA-binding transcriptional regulator/O6-methylguanine-DNA methyltransferase Ada n=3 Tax=Enterobacterales TaxID=91347 RepID=A0AAI9MV52_PROST|nr:MULTISPECIES: bifunctional DNA-binding transcriptional regulator/O6-methylguanine-DNA methyltransferase Ada [Providencia]ELR5035423.1 bifunctional DNA-binding transcriptional regulator/O6-methylguanine-DNA methyltransferase Ada [Providencia stuartii]ELR5119954.1 bifunctional DNA-binding transcriptional regulator/O6-methylguanine-DNA methyltransferase Ada [Providencia stuartii]ELR5141710.1 bifunctional DNA-binding transcriptional regulator/O6-methylguanine-DNA methyltransferase Ada [Providenci